MDIFLRKSYSSWCFVLVSMSMFFLIGGCARVCARARVHVLFCSTLRARVDIRVHARAFARACAIQTSNTFNSGYEHQLYESSRWKPDWRFTAGSDPPSGRSASGLSLGRFIPFGRSIDDNSKSCWRNSVSWIYPEEQIVTAILSYTRRPGKFV
jgi:hypothetical protein